MKKIIFFGDSITDMGRNRDDDSSFGCGYPSYVVKKLGSLYPSKYLLLNRGISGDRIVDLYARIKKDVWNEKPDYLFILIGVNDVWHEIDAKNGVDIKRFEKVYRMLIEDTLNVLRNVRIILFEPFVLYGEATKEHYDKFLEVKDYAKVVKRIAKDLNLSFIPLQERLDEGVNNLGIEKVARDGVHPDYEGATIIADAFMDYFYKEIEKK
ncbi:MAG: SGNH/GDSL hydrolase family protein [Bacilli bacterium]|nr:SGNH/GDSL hydrolase family protein [Bacilli bacterium]